MPLRSPCFTSSNLLSIPSPTTPRCPCGLVCSLRKAYRGHRVSFRSHHDCRDHSVIWASSLASRLATSKSRIEFILLRTGRSLPVASHHASRRRSDFQLQSSNQTLTRTFTPQIRCAHRRTGPACWRPGREATRVNDIGNQTVKRLPNEVCDVKVRFASVSARWPVDRRWSGLLSLRDPASSRPGHPLKQRQSSGDRGTSSLSAVISSLFYCLPFCG